LLGSSLLIVYNVPFDWITFGFCLWNLVVAGLAMIFWKGPLYLQQIYLVLMSSMMAYSLTTPQTPALTTWILLVLLAIWDLIAVLCPFGPLRVLIETAKKEDREIPALLYSGITACCRSANAASTEGAEPENQDEDEEDDEKNGLKLGLGDFVFYSVLIGRAALFDWITTIACMVAVLTGLNTTIFLLVIYRRALPALPISIAFGVLFYFVSSIVLTPFMIDLVQLSPPPSISLSSALIVGKGMNGGMIYV
ncbi:Presenilin-domain-containing protein, partial [Polychytrium aggregatum]|uniref:Presenilin-domain-containing protein n=1 Tax=Polychytrium aggregatum TaxID=110093 RepID=UPI0022FDDB9B